MVDPATGVSFPGSMRFWDSAEMECLGVGVRRKRVAGTVAVKVYAVAVYADRVGARAALEGAAVGAGDAGALGRAVAGGAYDKVFQLELVRSVSGETFSGAIRSALSGKVPSGELDAFVGHFASLGELGKGSNVVLRCRASGTLEVAVGGGQVPWARARPGLKIRSADFCRALSDLYREWPARPPPRAGAAPATGGPPPRPPRGDPCPASTPPPPPPLPQSGATRSRRARATPWPSGPGSWPPREGRPAVGGPGA